MHCTKQQSYIKNNEHYGFLDNEAKKVSCFGNTCLAIYRIILHINKRPLGGGTYVTKATVIFGLNTQKCSSDSHYLFLYIAH